VNRIGDPHVNAGSFAPESDALTRHFSGVYVQIGRRMLAMAEIIKPDGSALLYKG
jgi:hypothetical protein